MQPLLDALSSIGAECNSTDGKPPVKIKGNIAGGDVTIPGNLSSQFISSLLIAAPLTKNGINLTIQGDLVSKPYLDATIRTMREFGVSVQTLIPYKKYNVSPQIYKIQHSKSNRFFKFSITSLIHSIKWRRCNNQREYRKLTSRR